MQTDIQTFKHWTAASKPNSWLLGLSTSQPDKPLPTGGSQIFLGDPQSHRRSFGLGLHCGSGVQGIFHPQGASQEWKKQHALANRAIVTSLLHPWIGRGVPSHQGFDVQRCSKISRTGGPRPRISRVLTMLIASQEQGSGYQMLPGHLFHILSHENLRTPEVFLREFILMNWISQDVYGLKKMVLPPSVRRFGWLLSPTYAQFFSGENLSDKTQICSRPLGSAHPNSQRVSRPQLCAGSRDGTSTLAIS